MDYVFVGLVVVALLIVLRIVHLSARTFERFVNVHERFLELAADERRELLNRAQFPERMPTKTTGQARTHATLSPETRRELHSVGRVAPQVTDGD